MATACIPSRGLIHSRTIEGVLTNTKNIEVTHNLPIPNCFNWFVNNVMGDLWFVEEDVLVEPGTLQLLEALNVDIATANYKLPGGIDVVHKHGSGFILGGTGCTLIKRKVFHALKGFRSDTEWSADKLESWQHTKKVYGKHDVDFFIRAQMAGFTVGVLDRPVKHLRVKQMGEERTNVGWHDIIEL